MRKKHLQFFIFLFVVFQCFSQQNIPTYNYSDCDFNAIGYRGYSDIYPENTLLSIEEAFKRGTKYCEIDINITSDDVYVLYHDQPTMYRASSGNGYVVSSTYEELLELDFGSWKGSQFKGTKIATLEEALLLAEKYDAHLYLDTKKFNAELMGKALKKAKVNPNRLLSAIVDLEEAKEYKKYCPDSPFVYFGGLPEDPSDDNFYKELIDLGCLFFETYYTYALDDSNEDFKIFLKKVHEHNAEVWVFTSNDLVEIDEIKSRGVDGVESDVATSAMKALCNNEALEISPINFTTGNWTFDNGDLTSLGVGSQLRPFNYNKEEVDQPVQFGTASSFGINKINGVDANIIQVPAFDPQNGLFIFTNFTSGVHEELHYNFSLLMDVYIPKKSENKWISIYQSNSDNDNDAELFIGAKGIGISNVYHKKLIPETWYRLGIVVTETAIKKYVNGVFVGENKIEGGRWSVYNVFAGGQDQGFLLFSDDNNETAEFFVSAVQLRNYSMSPEEIKRLDKPDAKGIAISNSGIYDLHFEGELKQNIVNWDNEEIYVRFPKGKDLSSIKTSFKIPYAAKTLKASGGEIDLSSGTSMLSITAQDGFSKTDWNIIAIRE
jgi:glycerophosphoryl diester phosphodiesterase